MTSFRLKPLPNGASRFLSLSSEKKRRLLKETYEPFLTAVSHPHTFSFVRVPPFCYFLKASFFLTYYPIPPLSYGLLFYFIFFASIFHFFTVSSSSFSSSPPYFVFYGLLLLLLLICLVHPVLLFFFTRPSFSPPSLLFLVLLNLRFLHSLLLLCFFVLLWLLYNFYCVHSGWEWLQLLGSFQWVKWKFDIPTVQTNGTLN